MYEINKDSQEFHNIAKYADGGAPGLIQRLGPYKKIVRCKKCKWNMIVEQK